MKKLWKWIIIASVLFAVDLGSHLLVRVMLEREQVIGSRDTVAIIYKLNRSGLVPGANRLFRNKLIGYGVCLSYTIFAFALLWLKKRCKSRMRLWVFGILFYFGIVFIAVAVDQVFGLHTDTPPVSLFRLSAVVLFSVLFHIATNRIAKLGLLLMILSGIGNTVNFWIPPSGVVDFLCIGPFNRLLGINAVYNLADFYCISGMACLVIMLFTQVRVRPLFYIFNKGKNGH